MGMVLGGQVMAGDAGDASGGSSGRGCHRGGEGGERGRETEDKMKGSHYSEMLMQKRDGWR